MSGEGKRATVVLAAGLYPDAHTIEAALAAQRGDWPARRIDMPLVVDGEQEWDAILDLILKAEKVVTL